MTLILLAFHIILFIVCALGLFESIKKNNATLFVLGTACVAYNFFMVVFNAGRLLSTW